MKIERDLKDDAAKLAKENVHIFGSGSISKRATDIVNSEQVKRQVEAFKQSQHPHRGK